VLLYSATADRHRALVFREQVLVGTGRWTGTRIEALSAPLVPPAPGEDDAARASRLAEEDAILSVLSRRLAGEEAAASPPSPRGRTTRTASISR
jgi:hypothetical protein